VKRLFTFLVVIFTCSCPTRAQDAVTTIEETIADIFEQYSAEMNESIDYETFYEDLLSCSRNPINLNKATQEDLDRLPFLSDIQVENILSYVYSFGPLETIYELQLIDGLDMTDIRRMLPFVVVGEADETNRKGNPECDS